jgi:type II secretory pathway pseudopilin PulG
LDDEGYILVALLIGMAIAAVWMGALLPAWRQQIIRERETELVFRGEQYARAILLYSQKMNGALPSSMDDLISQHVLRHKWNDPITDDDFLPKVGCAGAVLPGGAGVGPGGAPGRGATPGAGTGAGRSGTPAVPGPTTTPGRGVTPGAPNAPAQPGRGTAPGAQAPGGFGQPQQGGICGVQSKSKDTSIRIYQGQQEYDLWPFDINTARVQFAANVQKLGGGVGAAVGLPGTQGGQTGGPGAGRGGPGGRGPVGPGTNPVGPGGPGRGLGPGGNFPTQAPLGPGRGRG